MRLGRISLVLGLLAACGSCDRAVPREATSGEARAANATVARAARVEVPEGVLNAGSMPGSAGRAPALEADLVPVEVPSFEIDTALAHGADGAPRLASTRDEAAGICAGRGERLCHELEWERACVVGAAVEQLGAPYAEWTASSVRASATETFAVVRGLREGDAPARRCVARRLVPAASVDPKLAFRCCSGDELEVAYPTEPERPIFEPVTFSVEDARAALAAIPQLERLAQDFRFFRPTEQDDVVNRGLERTPPVPVNTARIVRTAVSFTPTRGDTVVVFSGRSGPDAVIAVVHRLPDGRYVHAASLVMPRDPSNVVLFQRDESARELGFSSCLGCGGEDGEVLLRADGRFAVVTR